LPYFLILIWISACSIGKKEPQWINQNPLDPGYYSAVVRISRKAPDYLDLARDNALKEISTQINVTLDSEVSLKEMEANGIPSAEIINQIRSSSRSKLSNIQLAGSYQNKTDYWAYYRLSKSEYMKWRFKQRDLAIEQAKVFLQEFDQATTDIAPGITSLLKAMELIVDFADLDLRTSYSGRSVNIYNELLFRFNRLPEMISLSYSQNQIKVVAKQREKQIIGVQTAYVKDNQTYSARSFPIVFSFRNGKGDIVRQALSDNTGQAELIIRRITDFSNPQFIEMTPDKDYWLSRVENPLVKRMLNILQFSPVSLQLSVSRPKAYLDYSFNNGKGNGYRDLLVKKLQDLDLEVVADSASSDYIFRIMVMSRESEYVSRLKLFSASADAYVELLQSKGFKSIYNTNLTNLKSTGADSALALQMSELNAVAEICDQLLFMLVEQHVMY
jgi:hypothetical protein